MATSTTNFGLTKPAYNEAADVAVINGNMDTVDTVMGVNRNLAKGAQAGLAIVADGDTHAAITAGQYVYVRNNTHSLAEGLYVASANVSANGNITGSNMTAVSGGGLNALNSKLNILNSAGLTPKTGITIDSAYKVKAGNIVTYNLVFSTDHNLANAENIIEGFEIHKGGYNGVPTVPATNNTATVSFFGLNDNGEMYSIDTKVAGRWRMSLSYVCN